MFANRNSLVFIHPRSYFGIVQLHKVFSKQLLSVIVACHCKNKGFDILYILVFVKLIPILCSLVSL